MKINNDVPLTEFGQNKNIKFHILDTDIMQSCGFRFFNNHWFFCIGITDTISMIITIEQNEEGKIDIMDDDFMQPYDFQSMINKGNPNNTVKIVQKKVYEIMENLIKSKIITGWNRGDYI